MGHVDHHRGRASCRPASSSSSDTTRLFDEQLAAARRAAGHQGPGRRRRPAAGRLLQGSGEERAHLRRDAARPLLRARRLGGGERRRPHADAARPRLGVHQHRRREGLPGGGRGGREALSGRRRTASSSACRTSGSAKPSPPWCRPRRAARWRGAEGTSSRSTSPATRRPSTSCRSTRSTAARPARRTSSAPRQVALERLGLA